MTTPRLKLYTIISRAVEEGLRFGVQRAFKHTNEPDHDFIIEQCQHEIMVALDEVIVWDEDEPVTPCTSAPLHQTTTVVDALFSYDIFVGQFSRWSNPYVIGPDGSPTEVLDKYRTYLMTHPDLCRDVPTLRGKVLGCWCWPNEGCHGRVLAELANHPDRLIWFHGVPIIGEVGG